MLLGSHLKTMLIALFLAAAIGLFDFGNASLSIREGLTISDVNEPQRNLQSDAAVNNEERGLVTNRDIAEVSETIIPVLSELELKMKVWSLTFRRFSAKEAYTNLGLENAGKNLLSDPNFMVWKKFMENKNNGNREAAAAEMIVVVLPDGPKEKDLMDLVKMLTASMKAKDTKDIAKRLQLAMMAQLATKKISSPKVFQWLGLNTDLTTLLTHPNYDIFTIFLELSHQPDKLIKVILDYFSNSYGELAAGLEKAEKFSSTEMRAKELVNLLHSEEQRLIEMKKTFI